MMALLEQPRISTFENQNCKVRPINIIEKDVIKNVIGNDPEIPQTIYNRIQEGLNKGKNVNAILKLKTDDGSAYWTVNRFEPSVNNKFKAHFTVATKFTTKKCIEKTQKLYHILNSLEVAISEESANKYLEGFLEEKCITFNEIESLFA